MYTSPYKKSPRLFILLAEGQKAKNIAIAEGSMHSKERAYSLESVVCFLFSRQAISGADDNLSNAQTTSSQRNKRLLPDPRHHRRHFFAIRSSAGNVFMR